LLKPLKKIFSFFKKRRDILLFESDHNRELITELLNKESIIGLDTEFDWRNTYKPNLSMIQISLNKKIILLDCIKIKNLDFLKPLLEDKNRLNIFHSARSDTTVLFSSIGIKISNVYDIQVAEQIITDKEKQNYASLVKKYYSVNLKKSETNSNWLKRPFSKKQLDYASDDVEYLMGIYKKQIKILKKLNLLEKVFLLSKKEANLGNEDLQVSRIKKLKKANFKERTLFIWRETKASELNVPSSYIFKDKHLKELSASISLRDKANIKKILKDNELTEKILRELQ
tara:strand:- start:1793 stop:2647 length:855 start_codon:yes stop_codon:yes gene_type:complete